MIGPGISFRLCVRRALQFSFKLLRVNAEIIAVGSELLTPFRTDTNSLYLTEQLNQLGIEVTFKSIVGDNLPRLVAAARKLSSSAAAWVPPRTISLVKL